MEHMSQLKEINQKMIDQLNLKELENQKQQEKIEQLVKVIESNEELKAALNVSLIQEQNTAYKNKLLLMHR